MGTKTSMTTETVPLRAAISSQDDGGHWHFARGTTDPPLHTRLRLNWRFHAAANDPQQTKEIR